jgi:N,N-dimethylformamidase
MQPELTGYTDRWSVASGQQIQFMVSTDSPAYEAAIVRLIHADERGPGYKEEVIEPPVKYAGRQQVAHAGSFVVVPDMPALENFTIQTWIYPTMPASGKVQGVVTRWANEAGYALVIGEHGDLNFWLGSQRITTDKPLRAREWYFVAASYDSASGLARLVQLPLRDWPADPSAAIVDAVSTGLQTHAPHTLLLFGALSGVEIKPQQIVPSALYNGKMDNPTIFDRALSPAEIEALARGSHAPLFDSPSLLADDQRKSLRERGLGGEVAAWDFSDGISTSQATDRGPRGLHGVVVNMPTRAVTGHTWDGSQTDFKAAPDQYTAIHFHDDDLDDARWEADFNWTIPDGLKSGVYAARLTAENREDRIPFVVRPQVGKPSAPALVLLPTMTYLAYANYRGSDHPSTDENGQLRQPRRDPRDFYLAEHPEFASSIYDRHSDGSGVCYSSRLRPILNMRPKYRWGIVGGPRHFAADLYLIDWLEAKNFAYDVATDEDLHFDGLDLLSNYKVLLTGTHPEYWTTPMRAALESYLANGGRIMYLGGNGFYWVTSVDPERPHLVEVRRNIAGTRAWESAPGEWHHSTTGEYGGLWRYRGKAPQTLVGVGFTAQGWDGRAPGFTRQPGSFDERAKFIFEGVGDDEIIGNFGLVLGGAAGDELDRVDYTLGSPYHVLVLATSSGHVKTILPVIENFNAITNNVLFEDTKTVYADMVYFETPNGGAVFSGSAITWCASLSHNGYDNNLSRVTENVLRKFISNGV